MALFVNAVAAILSIVATTLIMIGLRPLRIRPGSYALVCGIAASIAAIAHIAQFAIGAGWWVTPFGIGLWLYAGSEYLYCAYHLSRTDT